MNGMESLSGVSLLVGPMGGEFYSASLFAVNPVTV